MTGRESIWSNTTTVSPRGNLCTQSADDRARIFPSHRIRLADLKFVDYLADVELLREARALAEGLLKQDPQLEKNPRLLELIHDGDVEVG